MSERLEEIKERFKAMNELPSFKKLAPTELFFDDIDYLIQQAERVEELENNIKVTDFFNRLYKKRATELELSRKEIAETVIKEYQQNKRYKHALEEISDATAIPIIEVRNRAIKALGIGMNNKEWNE